MNAPGPGCKEQQRDRVVRRPTKRPIEAQRVDRYAVPFECISGRLCDGAVHRLAAARCDDEWDEQREAHLDEGFARFWEAEIVRAIGADETWNRLLGYPHDPVARSRQGLARAAELGEAVVQMPTSLFYPGTTGAQAYARPHLIWTTASRRFGGDEVDRVLSTYFRRWRFRHPGTDDLLQVADEVGPPELAAFLREALRATGSPDYRVDDAGSERWSPPLGWLETDAGATW